MTNETEHTTTRFRLSQETIAIVTVGIALAGLNLASVGDLRDEARADRAAWQAESRQLRDEARADREDFQRQIRADREDFQRQIRADREDFQRQILRLTAQSAKLAAAVDASAPHTRD